MATLSTEGAAAAAQIEALPDEEKKAAVQKVMAANESLFPAGDEGRTTIWMTLLIGLFVLGISALIATVILALKGKDFSAVIALGTAIVGGVIGLFAKSPTG